MGETKEWKESTWLKDLKIKAALPFEDTAFTTYYRAVLLRNVQFCEVVTIEDRVACVRMTNKFIYQAIETAFGIHNGCLLYTSPSPRDRTRSRMPSSA